MKGTSNRVGMATLKELMSGEDITTSQDGFQMSNLDSVLETCVFIQQSTYLIRIILETSTSTLHSILFANI